MTVDIPDWIMRVFAFFGALGFLVGALAIAMVTLSNWIKERNGK